MAIAHSLNLRCVMVSSANRRRVAVRLTAPTGKVMTQADGATVFVTDLGSGKFNVVIQNKAGQVITTFQNISQKNLDRLLRNYGWK